ncbi:hypothetical protein QM996_25790 (plasmid) [Sinorhizobium chiapasense]|uniref:hypothetical protein n=1 Tax=Sinorhizobium chiapasense TaxID=501572 RepID=UPI002FE2608D
MSEAQITDNHDEIRHWAEARKGRPARVKGALDGGILRIDFGEAEPNLEPISWDEFFRIFDHNKLLFLRQDKTADGSLSRFNKFVGRP